MLYSAGMLLLASLAAAMAVDEAWLTFKPADDWELVFRYEQDACPNINPRTGHKGDSRECFLSRKRYFQAISR